MMKRMICICVCLCLGISIGPLLAQSTDTLQMGTLHLDRKDKKSFSVRDSSLVIRIDTLIMKDRSQLIFYGKKNVELHIQYGEFGKDALITGTDGKNNGTDMTIYAGIGKLDNLIVDAGGRDAFNGTKTHPNGDGGHVEFYYLSSGLTPQQESPKQPRHLLINVRAGGHRVNPQSEVGNILSRIGSGNRPLGRLPQGQVYSGSPGKDGEAKLEAIAVLP